MPIIEFPAPELADDYGLLAVGGDLEVQSLLLAYSSGIFPWPHPRIKEIPWFCPPTRALLFFDNFQLNRTLKRELAKQRYHFEINKNFRAVISHCAKVTRAHEKSTWIKKSIIDAYTDFHRAGYAHSVECYEGAELCGGLYGVSIGGMFAGESMFHLKPNASKLCLWHLVQHLKAQDVKWIDCQNMTPFLASLGATEVSRTEFLALLKPAVKKDVDLFK